MIDIEAANTFEGDVENDTNAVGGIEDFEQESSRRRRRHERDQGPRRAVLQGKKTHEQQLRILERKPDVPDSRQIEQELTRMAERGPVRRPREGARQSEFAVSRGGVNQESQHNKHNHQSQTGHKPPKTRG